MTSDTDPGNVRHLAAQLADACATPGATPEIAATVAVTAILHWLHDRQHLAAARFTDHWEALAAVTTQTALVHFVDEVCASRDM
jgi:hypothetical protein